MLDAQGYERPTGYLYQYDLQQPASTMPLLIDSVYDPRGGGNEWPYGDMKLAPDGKIYINSFYPNGDNGVDSMAWYLQVINAPDSAGVACHLQRKAVYIGAPTKSWDLAGWGMPNFPYYCGSDTANVGLGVVPVQGTTPKQALQIYPNPFAGATTVLPAINAPIILTDMANRILLTCPGTAGIPLQLGESLAPGTYIIRNGTHVARFIKAN